MVVETVLPAPPGEDEEAGAGLEPRIIQEREETDSDFPEGGEEGPPDDWVPLRSSWQPSAQTWKPLAETWAQQRGPHGEENDEPVVRPGRAGGSPATPRLVPLVSVAPLAGAPVQHHAAASPVLSASAPGHPAIGPRLVTPPAVLAEEPVAPSLPIAVIPPEPIPAPVQQTTAPERIPRAVIPAEPIADGKVPAVIPEAASAVSEAVHAPSTPEVVGTVPGDPWYLLPLVWFNLTFDALLRLGGLPGRWFCGRAGRAVLATAGLLCLVAAAGLVVADGMGWTWLP
jgi:hypothetical protein